MKTMLLTLVVAAGLTMAGAANAQEDLAKSSGCATCHAVDTKKMGPSYKDIAAKYKGKPDARERVFHHVTSGDKVKFEDGHEEPHPIVKTTDPDRINNLVNWILSLR